eukprot:6470222-Amphidinium_carterae.1
MMLHCWGDVKVGGTSCPWHSGPCLEHSPSCVGITTSCSWFGGQACAQLQLVVPSTWFRGRVGVCMAGGVS